MKKTIIFTVILLATIVGIYFYNRLPPPVPKTSLPLASTQESTPLPTGTSTPTPVWKTYTNNKLGFSFIYPSGSNFSMNTLDQEAPDQLLYLHLLNSSMKKDQFISIEVYTGDRTILPPGPTPESDQKVILSYTRKTINDVNFESYILNGPCLPNTFQAIHAGRTYIFQDICGPTPEFDQLIQSVKFF